MRKSMLRRPLTALLALLMVMGMFTVGGFGVLAEDTKDLKLRTFTASELAAAAEEAGTVNSKDYPIFTTYKDAIGRKSTNMGNYMIYSLNIPYQDFDLGGRKALATGDTVRLTFHLMADDIYVDGDLCKIEWLLGDGTDYRTDLMVTYDDYQAKETHVDPTYGYEYKEFVFDVTLEGDVWDNPVNPTDVAQARIMSTNEASVSLYYYSCYNATTEQMLMELDGVAIGDRVGVLNYFENIYAEGDQINGIISYMGQYPGDRNNVEPYCYNALGFDHKGNYANLMDSLGMELDAGEYAMDFKMKTVEALGTTDKCLVTVWDGETKLAECNVTQEMVVAAGGGSGGYCTIRVPFTVPQESAGHNITFQVQLYDSNDFSLSQVAINLLVPADAQAPEDAQNVINLITNLKITDTEAIAAARDAYDLLDTIGKAWVGDTLAAKLTSYEKAQTSAQAVIDAITALGAASDVNKDNYTDKTEALEGAESQYKAFLAEYGETDTATLITNAQALTDFRTAYDAAKKEAEEEEAAAKRQAAIDNVKSLIEAIGEVTEDNYTEKGSRIEAAEAALATLRSDYGNEIDSEVSNLTVLTDARAKYDEYSAEPDVTYGDVNNDGKIDASDALEALQHSVELKTLEGDAFTAADVTNDGKVDATDALNILQYSVELIDHFPVEE